MKIIDLLKKDAIALNVSLTDKEEAIDKLISLHEKAGNLADKAAYKEAILEERLRARPQSEKELPFRTQNRTA